jgi:hypothetical protein
VAGNGALARVAADRRAAPPAASVYVVAVRRDRTTSEGPRKAKNALTDRGRFRSIAFVERDKNEPPSQSLPSSCVHYTDD